jgi:cytochrome c biogenesis protein CcdA
MTRDDVDLHVDRLDRSEPGDLADDWKTSLEALRKELAKARRLRWRWRAAAATFGATLAYVAINPRSLAAFNDIVTLLQGLACAAGLSVIAVGFIMERVVPVLSREDRVRSLLVCFGVPFREAFDAPASIAERVRGVFRNDPA